MEGSVTFFRRKTASTALKAIAGCRGGYRSEKAAWVALTRCCRRRCSGPGGVWYARRRSARIR
jgi:LPS sulfotransferase NodH